MAVEDRTRRSIDGIKQTEVNAQLSIARALEAVRAHPDAIMIDVLRYSETARVSVQASDGKRVLASLETNTATAAITCLARLAELLLHLLDPATGRAALARPQDRKDPAPELCSQASRPIEGAPERMSCSRPMRARSS